MVEGGGETSISTLLLMKLLHSYNQIIISSSKGILWIVVQLEKWKLLFQDKIKYIWQITCADTYTFN